MDNGAVGMMDSLLLYKILKNRTGAEISASGNPAIMSDTLKNNPMNEMKVFGRSKQESTTGANLIDVNSMLNDCLIKNEDETYSIKKTEDDRFSKAFPVNLKAGTAVRFDADIVEYNGAYNKPLQISFLNYQTITAGQVIVLNSDVTEVIMYQDSMNNHGTYTKFKNAILSIGDIQIPYEPYTGGKPSPNPDYPQQIVSAGSDGKIGVEVRGKNLFELTGIRDNEYLRIEKIENNTIYARPTNMNAESPGTTNYSNGWVNFSEKIKVISGILYTISLSYKAVQKMIEIEKLDPARILVFKDSENIILNEEIKQEIGKYVDVEIPLLIPDGTDSIYFTITCNNCSVAIKNIQIEEGGYTFYEPYHESQSLSISTPTGLPAIPVDTDGNYTDANGQQWIADYVDLKREKYVQNICDLPLKDIDLEWCTWGVNYIVSNGTGFYAYLTKYAHVGNTKTLATICQHNADAWGGRKIGCNAEVNGNYITISLHTSDLDDASDNKKAIESFKKIVEQTDAHVLYVRAEPIERDLTPEEIQAYKNLVTYAGTTIAENDADCYMEVSAGGGDALRAKKLALILGD